MHGGFSPPLSSRWERKLQPSETASAQNSMHLHRASFSTTRSHSRVGSGELLTHLRETSEGLVSGFNSPSESFSYSQSSSFAEVGNTGDLVTMPSEPSLRWSPALQSQEVFTERATSSRMQNSSWPNIDFSLDFLAGISQGSCNELGLSYIGGFSTTEPQGLQLAARAEAQKCGLCTKGISQRSPWSSHGILGIGDLPVVGILVCGHVYHAECLEQATPLMRKHDPPCPQCDLEKVGHKVQVESNTKILGFTGQAFVKGKLSRVGVATDDFTDPEFSCKISQNSNSPEASSRKGGLQPSTRSGERSFIPKPLLKRQFSLKGKLNRDLAISNCGSKKPGSPAKVSPENNTGEDFSSVSGGKKGQSSIFGFVKRR